MILPLAHCQATEIAPTLKIRIQAANPEHCPRQAQGPSRPGQPLGHRLYHHEERFQTRFQSVRLQPQDNESLADFLDRRWGAPIAITRQIAEGAGGNVRAALADLGLWSGWLD